MSNLIWPDYDNCIANLPNSILKYFGAETVGKTLPLLDEHLNKEYKNVVVMLLDGMGKFIMDKLLEKDGPFQTHLAGVYNSVFLSTTTAATTSILSGMQPCEHCWLGWECYYPQLGQNVQVFSNTIQCTDKQAADFNVAFTYTPYENIVQKIGRTGAKGYAVAPFLPPNPQSLEAICKQVKNLCDEPERKYIYAYWKHPDGLLHRYGSDSYEAKYGLREMENIVSEMAAKLEDTLLIVTADHGHIDNDYVRIQDYPKLMDCLVRLPSLEPRVLNFFVKEGMKETFKTLFNDEFGDRFLLMPVDEAVEKKLMGTAAPNPLFRGMLGDYLAIATGNLSIFFNDDPQWVSMHGSITEQEMKIPLILFGA